MSVLTHDQFRKMARRHHPLCKREPYIPSEDLPLDAQVKILQREVERLCDDADTQERILQDEIRGMENWIRELGRQLGIHVPARLFIATVQPLPHSKLESLRKGIDYLMGEVGRRDMKIVKEGE